MDSDGDGIGDLKGIIQKLDYLNDGTEGSLGVNTIWLSPIFESPNVDWGYDVSDHRKIDPDYGTMADLEELKLCSILFLIIPPQSTHGLRSLDRLRVVQSATGTSGRNLLRTEVHPTIGCPVLGDPPGVSMK